MEFIKFAMLCFNPPHGAGGRPHHNSLRFDDFPAEFHAGKHVAIGNTRCGEGYVAASQLDHLELF